jgi:glyoxylase-like metal-dependent hydrolase (beta-lactamase superfamily II)
MKSITDNVIFEDSFAGVGLGAIRLEQGIIFIDSPITARDAQVWRNSLAKSGSGTDRLLILLDEHLDRSIGAKAMKCTLLAHERTAQVLGGRPASSKPVYTKTGALWESVEELGSLHAILPEITFTHSMQIHWGEDAVALEYHPGPARGSIWAIIPSLKIAFIGDCVITKQPPFLASADLTTWLESLALLRSAKYREYILISSRSGVVNQEDVKQQSVFLKHIQSQMEKLGHNKGDSSTLDGAVMELMKEFNPRNRKEEELFKTRLSWGYQQLYSSHYHPSNKTSGH